MRLLLFSLALVACGQAVPVDPEAPRVTPYTCPATPCMNATTNAVTPPAVTGATTAVHSGDNLQTIYNAASCGDKLVLDEGVTFTASFVFSKQCDSSNWLSIVSSGMASIPVTTYVTGAGINGTIPSAPSLTHYATLRSTVFNSPAVSFITSGNVPGKYHYLAGIEVKSTAFQTYLISFTNQQLETQISQLPDTILLDRVYVHGLPAEATAQITRCIALQGNQIGIVNSFLSDCYSGTESQAILFYTGGAGFLIQNNFLSGSTQVIMSGGTGRTLGYKCNVAASPTPTTATATVNTCTDDASASVATPVVGTYLMFKIAGVTDPTYWVQVTGNTAGALTWTPALPSPPDTGTSKVVWGEVPTDITVKRNFLWKDPKWNPSDPSYDGIARSSKACLEMKHGGRMLFEGNVCYNTWEAGQNYSVNLNSFDQFGDCPWCWSHDLNLSSNIFKNVAGGIVFIASEGNLPVPCPPLMARVLLNNNLWYAIGQAAYIEGRRMMQLSGYAVLCTRQAGNGGIDSLQIKHNNFLNGMIQSYTVASGGGVPWSYTNFVMQNNLMAFATVRILAECVTPPDGTTCFQSSVVTNGSFTISHNAPVNTAVSDGGISDGTLATRYGSYILGTIVDTTAQTNFTGVGFTDYPNTLTNYLGWKLTNASVFHNAASDGTDSGVNFTTLNVALGIYQTGPSSMMKGNMSLKGKLRVP